MSPDQVKEYFHYIPESGQLFWKKSPAKRIKVDTPILTKDSKNHLKVGFMGKTYAVHRVIWCWMTSQWPSNTIDHINGKRDDNRWSNLRDVPWNVNAQNRREATKRTNSTQLGVYSSGTISKPYRSSISVKGKLKNLGTFPTVEEAAKAFIKAKRFYHEGCTL